MINTEAAILMVGTGVPRTQRLESEPILMAGNHKFTWGATLGTITDRYLDFPCNNTKPVKDDTELNQL
jgi:hypothetical protein